MKPIPRWSPDPEIRKQQLLEHRLKTLEEEVTKIKKFINWQNRKTKLTRNRINDNYLRAPTPSKKAVGSDQ